MIGLFGKNDWIFQIMHTIYAIFIRVWNFFDNNLKSNYGLSRERSEKKMRENQWSSDAIWTSVECLFYLGHAENSSETKISQTNKVHES